MLSAKADYHTVQKRTTYIYSFLREGIQGKLDLASYYNV